MIALTSEPTDEALERLAELETKRVEAAEAGQPLDAATAGGYRHPSVKKPLMAETHEKCAYCESMITHVYFGDVEHMLPKTPVPESMFDYDNLTIACAKCNNAKSDYHDPQNPLLNPYSHDPSAHLVAGGPFLFHRPGSAVGDLTLRLLDLNRTALHERRLERLKSIAVLADKYEATPDGALKELLKKELLDQGSDDREFALVVRTYLAATYGVTG